MTVLVQEFERVKGNGSVDRMMALAGELGLTEADLAHLPHQFAAEIAEGCIWDGEQHGVVDDADWHAIFRAEADIAVAAGLEGIVAYLLCQFWEEGVENILHHPQLSSDMSPEDVARRVRLKLRADATFL
ncbi:hypothetical protein ACGFNP_25100 [Nonomuraea sp. NPDC049269]|uniref:hypothetical protein n=1 Tax=Nonomuraea sp. NPDC049269 TaxID=3364349 RepID=UPI00371DDC2E